MDIGLGRAVATLESRFADLDHPVLLTGIQALVRLLLEQARLDRAAGLHTGALVSGYRGSPLGGLDQELWRRARLLAAHDIHFQPGLNEDLAATMLMGTQILDAFPGARVDGAFGMWYAKGPGVDRSGDALHCANMAGTHRHGGVLAIPGDDHGAHSSTYPHQTEFLFQNVFVPVLNPGSVQDMIDLGLAGYALSRYSGLWVALKTTAETVEQAATVTVRSQRGFVVPELALPPHGLNFDPHLRIPADRAELERRVIDERLPAVLAWARANRLDRLVSGAPGAPIGLVTVGKAHEDTLHALRMLGLARDPRIALYKVALTWPLETEGLRDFARFKRVLFVIEEKRPFVEPQLRDALYHLPAAARPDIVGKTDARGAPLLSPLMELSPESVAAALLKLLGAAGIAVAMPAGDGFCAAPRATPARPIEHPAGLLHRAPAFCAGCPHSTSTKVPEGSFATGGIGCHIMALDAGDQTRTYVQMGGEGIPSVGMAPFTDLPHTFANLGDGTYQHSGSLAIRQALAAHARITFKLLFNDAVAMTGGQPAEGAPTVPRIAAQLAAEGVQRIAVVADDAARLPRARDLPPGTTRHPREQLDAVQRELRDYDGVSVLIYDQVCATEKRRRRKRGLLPQPPRHVVINQHVCENCGDCSVQSGCIAIEPVETALGRKRRINPTSCNVDLSCLKGFCPSFVTVAGAPSAPDIDLQWEQREAALAQALPQPQLPDTTPWRGLFAGIGGGGIVTAGAILAMAAHIEGRQVRTLDFTGLAQKNGAVVAHVQIADSAAELDVVRIPLGAANVMIAADLAVGCAPGVLERTAKSAVVVGNLDLAATAAFKQDPRLPIDAVLHRRTIEHATDAGKSVWLHGVRIAETLFGHAQAMNTLLLGVAWQRGLVPVGQAALLRAIALNGAAVEMNRRAFLWGRILAQQPELADEILRPAALPPAGTIEELVVTRAKFLTHYQSERYAGEYRALMSDVIARENAVAGRPGKLSRAAAEGLFRVMACKDEYEVARLHAEAAYGANPVFHLAPPLLARVDPATGRPRKMAVPGWLALPLFRALRHGKRLRGTRLDPFGRLAERRQERASRDTYVTDLRAALAALRPDTLDTAVALAALPDMVRGFGPVKDANRRQAEARRATLLALLAAPPRPAATAAPNVGILVP
ncbi:MAG TPA: indolepyruvate ferredoxin oxidoreductase family protein [Acetobacteraceae bacterium]|nr:indolepyruvate ferredoxin oxidoreductase family protein [Acetobacteraceae bacterium]